ncbi:hypothetical protein FQR65_LT14308 [Abscondita terminalis]|nr:hypothetical protein FQR65_LT14308 [Abscondita terminalis]
MQLVKINSFIVCWFLTLNECLFVSDEDIENELKNTSPLILTPYIQSGNIKEARKAAEVHYDEIGDVKSYAGYFTVSKQFNSNLFFWFFPSESDYQNAPVVLWLQGGPGASSFLGSLIINGAFEVTDDLKLKKRAIYWSQTHSVLYIDSPVGSGFSFTDEGGYTRNETIVAQHLYSGLLQFFQMFPELKENGFFVTGESYAGKYVPVISHYIMKQNPGAPQKINLKGLAIGNGRCDPENQLEYAELLYHLGLVDLHGKKLIQEKVDEIIDLIHKKMWVEAYDTMNNFINGNSGELTLFKNLTGFTNYYNLLDVNSSVKDTMRKYVDFPKFRLALHVGNIIFDDGEKVLAAMIPDIMQSVAPLLTELLDQHRVLFYNGQLDIILAPPVQLHFLQKLKFKDSEAYKSAQRHFWMIDGDIAGYVKEAGNIMEIMIHEDIENELKNTFPLILTPYIQSENIKEARKAAEVHYDEIGDVKSYAGYFTVSKQFNSNLFFWFFPSESDYENAPVVLWLQGGPGASSVLGSLEINGAFEVTDDLKLKKRAIYWSQTHSVLYIDSPVGSGFSFTDEGGYTRNETIVAQHLYSGLLQFFQMFPELKENGFFVTGESYAGKYVPVISHYIMKQNPGAPQKINLKGLAIGNGRCDPENQLEYAELLYHLGLVDLHGKKLIQEKVDEIIDLIHKKMWVEAYDTMNNFINGNSGELTLFKNLTGFTNYYNLLDAYSWVDTTRKYVDFPKFRLALHVGNIIFDDGEKVLAAMIPVIMQTVAPLLTELLDQHRVLFYNGQLDIILAPPVQLHFLQKLKFKDSEAYKSAQRHFWMIDGDIAGYVKEAGNIMEIMIRNSGHMVPTHQPKWALDMLTRFTRNQSFY